MGKGLGAATRGRLGGVPRGGIGAATARFVRGRRGAGARPGAAGLAREAAVRRALRNRARRGLAPQAGANLAGVLRQRNLGGNVRRAAGRARARRR